MNDDNVVPLETNMQDYTQRRLIRDSWYLTGRHPYLDINAERLRAHIKHVKNGRSQETISWDDPSRLPVLVEEVGEVAQVINDGESIQALRAELIQVAAMATGWVAAIDRELAKAEAIDVEYTASPND